MIHQGLGPGARYATRRLAPPDLSDLQAMFVRATDYFELATGRGPARDEAERAFVGGPPTVAVSDKLTVGIFDETDGLVGVLDAVPGFPAPGTCSIGMLLLEPAARGAGLGGAVLAAFETWVATRGTGRVRTALGAQHAAGLRFLARAGYVELSRLSDYDAGAARTTIVLLEKALPGHL